MAFLGSFWFLLYDKSTAWSRFCCNFLTRVFENLTEILKSVIQWNFQRSQLLAPTAINAVVRVVLCWDWEARWPHRRLQPVFREGSWLSTRVQIMGPHHLIIQFGKPQSVAVSNRLFRLNYLSPMAKKIDQNYAKCGLNQINDKGSRAFWGSKYSSAPCVTWRYPI